MTVKEQVAKSKSLLKYVYKEGVQNVQEAIDEGTKVVYFAELNYANDVSCDDGSDGRDKYKQALQTTYRDTVQEVLDDLKNLISFVDEDMFVCWLMYFIEDGDIERLATIKLDKVLQQA